MTSDGSTTRSAGGAEPAARVDRGIGSGVERGGGSTELEDALPLAVTYLFVFTIMVSLALLSVAFLVP